MRSRTLLLIGCFAASLALAWAGGCQKEEPATVSPGKMVRSRNIQPKIEALPAKAPEAPAPAAPAPGTPGAPAAPAAPGAPAAPAAPGAPAPAPAAPAPVADPGPPPPVGKHIALIYSSNLHGEYEPCG